MYTVLYDYYHFRGKIPETKNSFSGRISYACFSNMDFKPCQNSSFSTKL